MAVCAACGGKIKVRFSAIASAIIIAVIAAMVQPPLWSGAEAVPVVPLRLPGIEIAPQISASTAIAVDLTTGQELYAHNPDTPAPPASTVKIVTALVALEILEPDEIVTIIEADLLDEEYSVVGLTPGDQISVRNLLHGMLIASGGDASLALARVAGERLESGTTDPISRFVVEMNDYASSLGMTGSHFSDPVGFDSETTAMTARDLVRASEALLNDWLLSRIVAMPWTVVRAEGPNARDLVIENTNQYVLYGEGSFGVKTGTTELAGECLVNAAYRGDNKIITVVLGSDARYDDTNAIMEAIDAAVVWIEIGVDADSAGAREFLADENRWMPVGRTIAVPATDASTLTWEYDNNGGTGGKHGTINFMIAGRAIASLPVYDLNWQE